MHSTPLAGGDHDHYLGVHAAPHHVPVVAAVDHGDLVESHRTREALMEHQVAAHADLDPTQAMHHDATLGVGHEGQDHGTHYYPGRVYADEKAAI